MYKHKNILKTKLTNAYAKHSIQRNSKIANKTSQRNEASINKSNDNNKSSELYSQYAAQNFVDNPVHFTPVIISDGNENLPIHFINPSDRDIVVPKHTYVGAMEKVPESD